MIVTHRTPRATLSVVTWTSRRRRRRRRRPRGCSRTAVGRALLPAPFDTARPGRPGRDGLTKTGYPCDNVVLSCHSTCRRTSRLISTFYNRITRVLLLFFFFFFPRVLRLPPTSCAVVTPVEGKKKTVRYIARQTRSSFSARRCYYIYIASVPWAELNKDYEPSGHRSLLYFFTQKTPDRSIRCCR